MTLSQSLRERAAGHRIDTALFKHEHALRLAIRQAERMRHRGETACCSMQYEIKDGKFACPIHGEDR